MNNYKLFANCIIVRGAARDLICDLQRNSCTPIPASVAGLFDEAGVLDMAAVQNRIDPDDIEILNDYLRFLLGHEFVFELSGLDPGDFPALSLEWDFPGRITNAIIEIGPMIRYDFEALLRVQLRAASCRYLELRSYTAMSLRSLGDYLALIETSDIKSADIVTGLPPHVDIGLLGSWLKPYRKVRSLLLHSAGSDCIVQQASHGFGSIVCVTKRIDSAMHCGEIHPAYFSINIETFTEAQHYNSCLNRKLSVDVDGQIRNCPAMGQVYGNVRDGALRDIVAGGDFQRLWNIRKDDIEKCRTCEFRYVCVDCRAFLERPEDLYSAPLKCGYNPETCTWEDWTSDPLKQTTFHQYLHAEARVASRLFSV